MDFLSHGMLCFASPALHYLVVDQHLTGIQMVCLVGGLPQGTMSCVSKSSIGDISCLEVFAGDCSISADANVST